MPSPIEIVAPLAEAALVILPELVDVPILGRILLSLAPGGGNETKALEQLQEQANKKKTDRKTRIDRNARYVIKASEAMLCVEKNVMDGKVALAFAKGLANAILGRSGGYAGDILVDSIWTCIEEHVLRQDTPRVKGTPRGKYVRPRKGHGKGRGKF